MKNTILILFLIVCFFTNSYGQTVSRDLQFGNNGELLLQAENAYLQDDNKIINVYNSNQNTIIINKYTNDGKADTSFGMNGTVSHTFSFLIINLSQPISQSDGKILITGQTQNANQDRVMILLRFNSNGSLDNSFNSLGYFIWTVNSDVGSRGNYVIPLSSGKIIIGGTANGVVYPFGSPQGGYTGNDAIIWRFLANGTLDLSFNGKGYRGLDYFDSHLVNGGYSNDAVIGMALRTNGDILLAVYMGITNFGTTRYGYYNIASSGYSREVYSFGTISSDIEITQCLVQTSNKPLMSRFNSYNTTSSILRFTPQNLEDYTFPDVNNFYLGQSNVPLSSYRLNDMALINDKIITVGTWRNSISSNYDHFSLIRLNVDGTYDTSFNNGSSIYTENINGFIAKRIFVRPGMIIVSGTRNNNPVIVKYILGSNMNTPNFNNQKKVSVVPNPFRDNIKIQFENANTPFNYTIINFVGTEVARGVLQNQKAINLSGLASGVYLLQLEYDGNTTVKKIIKH